MSKFKQALKWMDEGKKVRRPKWKEKSFWAFGRDEAILFMGVLTAKVHLKQIMADDWEIYEEPKKEIPGVKKEIMVNGIEYKLMAIGIPVADDDIRYESSWYTKDPRKQGGN